MDTDADVEEGRPVTETTVLFELMTTEFGTDEAVKVAEDIDIGTEDDNDDGMPVDKELAAEAATLVLDDEFSVVAVSIAALVVVEVTAAEHTSGDSHLFKSAQHTVVGGQY